MLVNIEYCQSHLCFCICVRDFRCFFNMYFSVSFISAAAILDCIICHEYSKGSRSITLTHKWFCLRYLISIVGYNKLFIILSPLQFNWGQLHGHMRRPDPLDNLYPTSILISCILSEWKIVSVHLIPQGNPQRLRVINYTTATEIFYPSRIKTLSYPARTSLVADMQLGDH